MLEAENVQTSSASSIPSGPQNKPPSLQEQFDYYKLIVGNALSKDEAFINACQNSDKENAYLEGEAAISRIVTASEAMQLTKLYFDMPTFHDRMNRELLDELYPTLATMVESSRYCMYFKLFKPQDWRKRSAEARRRNCAVLP